MLSTDEGKTMSTFADVIGWAVIAILVLMTIWSAWTKDSHWTAFFALGAVVLSYGILAEPGWDKTVLVIGGGLLARFLAKRAKTHDASMKDA